ncbi:NACHT domain-containing protein [Tenacibaculum sp. TC6]|uniref:NACHT domain-containing protein n=1 Tax=Tenacibaculum sp. TC6 TaxID=3423223 RepID=UPI003D35B78A
MKRKELLNKSFEEKPKAIINYTELLRKEIIDIPRGDGEIAVEISSLVEELRKYFISRNAKKKNEIRKLINDDIEKDYIKFFTEDLPKDENKKEKYVKKYTISSKTIYRCRNGKNLSSKTKEALSLYLGVAGWRNYQTTHKKNLKDVFLIDENHSDFKKYTITYDSNIFDKTNNQVLNSFVLEKDNNQTNNTDKIIPSVVLTKLIDLRKRENKDFTISENTQEAVQDSLFFFLDQHKNEVLKWSREISINVLKKAKSVEKIYQYLEYYSPPLQYSYESVEVERKGMDLDEFFESNLSLKNLIILGQPGSGKTTSLKYLAYKVSNKNQRFKNVIVLRFRDFNKVDTIKFKSKTHKVESIFFKIYNIFDKINYGLYQENKELVEELTIGILNHLKVLVILDGFDEYKFKDKLDKIKELEKICKSTENAKIILTSRPGEFFYKIDNTDGHEIADLSLKQIKEFSFEWFNKDSQLLAEFLTQLQNSTYKDTIKRPLVLVHLLTIFENSTPNRIPREPYKIYDKVLDLLVKNWDKERAVERSYSYKHFNSEKKKEFLAELSFFLSINNKNKEKTNIVFQEREIKRVYKRICRKYKLPKDDYEKVFNEIESHCGVFIKVRENLYEFAHVSIQEYLTALYFLEVPHLFLGMSFDPINMANELAIFVAISEKSSYYLVLIVESILNDFAELKYTEFQKNFFLKTFFNRLPLENPDFEPSLDLALCLANLYTQNRISFNNGTHNVYREDNENIIVKNMLYLDSIFELESVKESIALLESYYTIINYENKKDFQKTLRKQDVNMFVLKPNSNHFKEEGIDLRCKHYMTYRFVMKKKFLSKWCFKTQ